MLTTIFQILIGLGILSSAFSVIFLGNKPVLAIVFLIITFVLSALYLILMGINFIGITYIILYVGAITVLFLFVIMMINIRLLDILEIGSEYTKNLPLAFLVGTLFVYEIFSVIPFSFNNVSNTILDLLIKLNGFILNYEITIRGVNNAFNPVIADTALTPFLQIEAIGQGLYTYGASWFIIISIILLLAMIAPIFISKTKRSTS